MLGRPLKVWHGVVAVVVALVIGMVAPSVATTARSGGLRYVTSKAKQLNADTEGSIVVFCPRGTVVTGGGVHISGGHADKLAVSSSEPWDANNDGIRDNGWRAWVENNGPNQQSFQVFAICKPKS